MRPHAAPLWEQTLIFVLGPPIGACLWWIMSRGWASSVQGGNVSEQTKRRQKKEFWVVLLGCYLIATLEILYAWLR